MTGENVEVFIDWELEYPVSLVIDHPSGRLFWADKKKHSIESIPVDRERGKRLTALDYRNDHRLVFMLRHYFISLRSDLFVNPA